MAISGHSHFAIISILNFGLLSTKLGGTVRAIKKMTHNDNGPDPDRTYGETAVFMFGHKVFFGQKPVFFPKKDSKFAKTLIFFLNGTFFLEQLFPVVARTWLE